MYKKSSFLFLIVVLLFLSSCESNKKKNDLPTVVNETLQVHQNTSAEEIAEQDSGDSINLDKLLIEALDISAKDIEKDTFLREYISVTDDLYEVKVKIDLDFHFTEYHPHLIIHRQTLGDIYIDIYSKVNKTFKKVLSHKEWSITYINDTIQDINGDNYNDFIINGYGSSGCCLKAYSSVYLFRPKNSDFSDCFDFLNPTFSPQEKIIRGVCYGHPGETEIYKYKWNGERVDTLEYLYYERDNAHQKTGALIIAKERPFDDTSKILKRLKSVPKEYTNIFGYDWFTGEGY